MSIQREVFCWGHGLYGQLGLGSNSNERQPRLLSALQNKQVKAIAAGEYHSVAVTEAGHVYSWGKGDEGQIGTGDARRNTLIPVLLGPISVHGIRQVACGQSHTVAVSGISQIDQANRCR